MYVRKFLLTLKCVVFFLVISIELKLLTATTIQLETQILLFVAITKKNNLFPHFVRSLLI